MKLIVRWRCHRGGMIALVQTLRRRRDDYPTRPVT